MLELFKNHISELVILLIFLAYLITEFVLRKNLKKIKNEINLNYTEENLNNIENLELLDSQEQDLYIEYYKWKNVIKYLRFATFITLLWVFIFLKKPWLFNFFAIAVWAIIITFKETIISFFWFFYITAHYKIWENIIVWDLKWEIIYINLLNIWLIWKNEYSEHNWQFYTIPNYKFILDNTKREDLWLWKYKKEEFDVYFKKEEFNINYEDFLTELKLFLDENILKRNISNVWNFKTFIWYKYKLRFQYDKDYLIVKIFWVDRQKNILSLQNKLALFVESKKK